MQIQIKYVQSNTNTNEYKYKCRHKYKYKYWDSYAVQGHLLVALNFVVGGGFKEYPHIYEALVVVRIRFWNFGKDFRYIKM